MKDFIKSWIEKEIDGGLIGEYYMSDAESIMNDYVDYKNESNEDKKKAMIKQAKKILWELGAMPD